MWVIAPTCKVLSALSMLFCALCVLLSSSCFADLAKWDFEDGTLQGWTLVSGDAGKQPSDNDSDRHGSNFAKQGKYFIGTFEGLKDEAVAEYRSPEFTVQADKMSLLVGGGGYENGTYLALCRASNGEILLKETGRNSEQMSTRIWDLRKIKGEKVFIRVVDTETGPWGHINVDDIRELTTQDIAALEQKRRDAEAAQAKWLSKLMTPSGPKVYRGKALEDITINLGGIGAGNIAVCGDGALRQWQIFNKVNTACIVPGQFFAIRAKAGASDPVTRMLRQSSVGNIPGVKETEFIGEFPIARINYKDPALPVDVSMEAFSPFIPMNSKDSGIPGVYFVFKVKNPTQSTVKVSLLGSMQNAVGYDGASKIDGVKWEGYGGNVNELATKQGYTLIDMANPSLAKDHHQNGSMALAVMSKASSALQWESEAEVLKTFASYGVLDPISATGGKGKTCNGALATEMSLNPGEEKSVVFMITWNFPNYYADYDKNLAQYRIGRMYTNWFERACKAADYMAANYPRLSQQTHLFRDALYDSNLPYWFTNRISAPISTLTSQTCLWIEDGTFHAFEGCGCCPMNCTHVWNYEQTLSALFPDLERNMRHTDLTVQQEPSGAIRHRTALPLSAPRTTGPFVDGHLGTILKCYREYQHSADGKWLHANWPHIKAAMDYVLREWDPNKDGVLVNEQWNTYDAAMYGPNTFIGTLYLGALRAAEEMAKVQGDSSSAKQYRKVFEIGSSRLDTTLWNGEYYYQIDEKSDTAQMTNVAWITEDWPKENPGANRPYGIGCHSDQLLGQWWANLLDLGYLLPQDRVSKTASSIVKYNWRWDFGQVAQQRPFAGDGDMGLLLCTWPQGGRPAQSILYADETWTGVDYTVAGILLHEGKLTEAFQIARSIEDRYDGVKRGPITRSPWNEIECGDHYARAMSSWSLLLEAQGMTYSGPDGAISFSPNVQPNDHRSFFSTAQGWGTFTQKRVAKEQTNSLAMRYGFLTLKTMSFGVAQTATPKSVVVTVNGKPVKCSSAVKNGKLVVRPTKPVMLLAGDTVSIKSDW